jgi:O-phospho-L-seryl-tRNASec:L-selenocysteinyl-tRNA synthase
VGANIFGLMPLTGRAANMYQVQPKAAGSSLLYVLTRHLVTHALNLAGLSETVCSQAHNPALVVPVATGMSLAITMMTIKSLIGAKSSWNNDWKPADARAPRNNNKPVASGQSGNRSSSNTTAGSSDCAARVDDVVDSSEIKYVIFSRIDQKSCFKSILTAGLVPIVIENKVDPVTGEMTTNVEEIERQLQLHCVLRDGTESDISYNRVMCVLTTTSCFAPRQPDAVDVVAKLCARYQWAHVINNAYGVQCQQICKLINRAHTIGRVDAVVQSTDKNFCVPVGGAVICSASKQLLNEIAGLYPGRASAAPVLDLFITLLSMGT